MNLMKGDQSDVWSSVREFTAGKPHAHRATSTGLGSTHHFTSSRGATRGRASSLNIRASHMDEIGIRADDLLGHLNKIKDGQSALDDMMQRVPLFPDQVGAILFNPVGVIALETFDHPKSWEAIKKEIIEKYGDKIKETQAEHLFELKPEMIIPMFKKFIEKPFTEKTIRKDELSETREIKGEGIVGEYTIVKGQPIHILLLKEEC